MSVTAAEVLLVIKGEVSAELQARFLREAVQPQSGLVRMLKAVEAWAQTKLHPNCPAAPSSLAATENKPVVKTLKKAAFWGDEGDRLVSPDVGINDLIDYISGTASPETVAKMKTALADPSSNLSQLFKQMEGEGMKSPRQPTKARRPKKS